jgi:hypothetical protein
MVQVCLNGLSRSCSKMKTFTAPAFALKARKFHSHGRTDQESFYALAKYK